MKVPKLPELRLLKRSLRLEGVSNLCFHRSAAFVFDVPGATMMFATFRAATDEEREIDDRKSPVPFIHAWAEFKGSVYAPTTLERTGGRLVPFDREEYYQTNGAHDFRILTRPQLLRLDRQFGLRRHLDKFAPLKDGAKFGAILLDAAGVDYRVDHRGSILPTEDIEGKETRIMTPAEVKAARRKLGLSCNELGEVLELEGKFKGDTVRTWENGRRQISGPARVALRLLLERFDMGRPFESGVPISAILEPKLRDPRP